MRGMDHDIKFTMFADYYDGIDGPWYQMNAVGWLLWWDGWAMTQSERDVCRLLSSDGIRTYKHIWLFYVLFRRTKEDHNLRCFTESYVERPTYHLFAEKLKVVRLGWWLRWERRSNGFRIQYPGANDEIAESSPPYEEGTGRVEGTFGGSYRYIWSIKRNSKRGGEIQCLKRIAKIDGRFSRKCVWLRRKDGKVFCYIRSGINWWSLIVIRTG